MFHTINMMREHGKCAAINAGILSIAVVLRAFSNFVTLMGIAPDEGTKTTKGLLCIHRIV